MAVRKGVQAFIDASDLDRIERNLGVAQVRIPDITKPELRRLGRKALDEARREAPVGKTRQLRDTLDLQENMGILGVGNMSVSVMEHVPSGPFVRLGTRPHVIRPRFKKALYWEGAPHPVKMVQHPGTAPNPYHERAVDNMRGDIERAGGKIVTDIAEEIVKP